MRKSTILIFSFVIILILSGIAGCGQADSFPPSGADEYVAVTNSDYPTTLDFQVIIDEADVIVMGNYEEFAASWNMARNPDDISKEDDTMYVEGKLYRFKVDKYLKGNGSTSIFINKKYKNADGTIDERFFEPDYGEPVVLFLKYNKDFDYYYGAIEPFEFKLINDKLQVKTNLQSMKKSFNEISLTELSTSLA